jgi:hypothetical protein
MWVVRNWLIKAAAVLALIATFPTLANSQTHLRSANLTPELIGTILQNYYRAPMSEQVPAIVQAAITQGMAENRAKRLALIAFIAGIVSEDATQIDRLAAMYSKLAGNHHAQLVRAILYSGRTDWKEQLERLKTVWPDKAAEIDAIASRGARAVYTLQRDGQPEVLDMNWAFFGATGRREPIMLIIEALGDLRATDPGLVTTAHAARMALAAQAIQHDRVFDICQRAQWGTYGNDLGKIVAAAQTKDLSRFKAEAEAAIRAAESGQPVPSPGEATAASARSTPRRP